MDYINDYKFAHLMALANVSNEIGTKLVIETTNGTINGYFEEWPDEVPESEVFDDGKINIPNLWRLALSSLAKLRAEELKGNDEAIFPKGFLIRDAKVFNGINNNGLDCPLMLVFLDQVVSVSIGDLKPQH